MFDEFVREVWTASCVEHPTFRKWHCRVCHRLCRRRRNLHIVFCVCSAVTLSDSILWRSSCHSQMQLINWTNFSSRVSLVMCSASDAFTFQILTDGGWLGIFDRTLRRHRRKYEDCTVKDNDVDLRWDDAFVLFLTCSSFTSLIAASISLFAENRFIVFCNKQALSYVLLIDLPSYTLLLFYHHLLYHTVEKAIGHWQLILKARLPLCQLGLFIFCKIDGCTTAIRRRIVPYFFVAGRPVLILVF